MPHRRRSSRSTASPPTTGVSDPYAGKLGGVKPIHHDEDADRPNREDLRRGGSLFDIPVPLPRFLKPRNKR